MLKNTASLRPATQPTLALALEHLEEAVLGRKPGAVSGLFQVAEAVDQSQPLRLHLPEATVEQQIAHLCRAYGLVYALHGGKVSLRPARVPVS